jgi:hypothetical protein
MAFSLKDNAKHIPSFVEKDSKCANKPWKGYAQATQPQARKQISKANMKIDATASWYPAATTENNKKCYSMNSGSGCCTQRDLSDSA